MENKGSSIMVVFDNQKQKYEFLDFKKILKKKYLAKPYYYIGLCNDEREAFEFALRYNETENVKNGNVMSYLIGAYLVVLFLAWELMIMYVASINWWIGAVLFVLLSSTLYLINIFGWQK